MGSEVDQEGEWKQDKRPGWVALAYCQREGQGSEPGECPVRFRSLGGAAAGYVWSFPAKSRCVMLADIARLDNLDCLPSQY